MNATMLPPLGSAFDHIHAELSRLVQSQKPAGIRISWALWQRIESWWKEHTGDQELFGANQIYGIPCLIDLALLGESYFLEAA